MEAFACSASPTRHRSINRTAKSLQHIRRRQTIVELERVEREWLTLEYTNIAQVQITVTASHLAALAPPLDQRTHIYEFCVEPLEQERRARIEPDRVCAVFLGAPQSANDLPVLYGLPGVFLWRRREMGACDRFGDLFRHSSGERTMGGQPIELLVALETAHHNRLIQVPSFAAQTEAAITASDRKNAEIEGRAHHLIDLEFGLACETSALAGRIVDKRQDDGALQLESPVA